jgi:hypothetical protein
LKRIGLLTLVVMVSLMATPIANASTFGVNGLVTVPTADMLDPTELNLTYQHIGDGDLILGSYGLKDGLEVGGVAQWPNGLDDDGENYLLVKVNVLKEDANYMPEMSLGIVDRNLYLVASKSTDFYGIRAHLGVADKDMIKDRVFVGINKVLNPVTISSGDGSFNVPTTTVALEYNDGFNLGANFDFGSGISANLGVLDFDDFIFGINFKNKF